MRSVRMISVVLTLSLAFLSGRAMGEEPSSGAAVASVDGLRLFIPVLVSNLPGVGGSVWDTELWVTNTSNQPVFYTMVPCTVSAGCIEIGTVDPQTTLIRGDVVPRPNGRWVDFNPLIQLEARIRDLSRNASSAGVELPIVREADFRSDEINLNGIPQDPRFRVTLRIYGLDAGGQVTVDQIDQVGHLLRTTAVVLVPPDDPLILTGYAQLAVDNVPNVPAPLRIRIRPIAGAPRIWAFASVTNNVTSEVTLIQPFRQ